MEEWLRLLTRERGMNSEVRRNDSTMSDMNLGNKFRKNPMFSIFLTGLLVLQLLYTLMTPCNSR